MIKTTLINHPANLATEVVKIVPVEILQLALIAMKMITEISLTIIVHAIQDIMMMGLIAFVQNVNIVASLAMEKVKIVALLAICSREEH